MISFPTRCTPRIAILGLFLGFIFYGIAENVLASEVPVKLEFDSSKYGKKKGKKSSDDVSFPKHTTVLMVIRQKGKVRPLFLLGKNEAGMIQIIFTNPGGMAPTFEATAKGTATVNVNHASATLAQDQDTFAAGELLDGWREKPIPVKVHIDKISDMKESGKKKVAKMVLTLKGRSTDKKSKPLVAKYSMKIQGRLQIGEKMVPFTSKGTMTLEDSLQFFTCSFTMNMTFKAKELGLKREKPDDEINFSFTTTAYSKMPDVNKAPSIDDLDKLEESEDMDIDF